MLLGSWVSSLLRLHSFNFFFSFQTLAGDVLSPAGKHDMTVMWARGGEAWVRGGSVGVVCHPIPSSCSSLMRSTPQCQHTGCALSYGCDFLLFLYFLSQLPCHSPSGYLISHPFSTLPVISSHGV